MKHLFNKLSAFLVMLMCMSATVQAEIVHHTVCEPTATSRGFNVECWENTVTNKFYTNEACTQELTGAELAKAVVYAKLEESPVTGNSEFNVVEYDNQQTWGVNLNWAAETTFSNAYSDWTTTPRYVQFTITKDNVSDARLVWMKNQGAVEQGKYTIKIYVNDVVTYSIVQQSNLEGVFIQSFSGLQKGDIVKFEVVQHVAASYNTANPTFKAALEYTYTVEEGIIHHAPCAPTASSFGFTQECWEKEGKFYSDAECTQELINENLAKTVIYRKLPTSPICNLHDFAAAERTENYSGVNFNWAAICTYTSQTTNTQAEPFAEFKVTAETTNSARIVWSKDTGSSYYYGRYRITFYINDVYFSHTEQWDDDLQGVFVQPLPELKKDDIVKFEIRQVGCAVYNTKIGFKASLEYTFDCQHEYPSGSPICSKCSEVKEHEHNYLNHKCTLCSGDEDGFITGYVGNDADHKNITWYLDKNTHILTFAGSGDMEKFEPDHNVWENEYRNVIQKVVIEEGITSIGDGAFIYGGLYSYFPIMSELREVSLPSTLKTIGSYAFYKCGSLNSITLPEGLESINERAFNFVPLKTLTLPSTLKYIGESVFASSSIQEVIIPESVETIDGYAFRESTSLKKVIINGNPTISLWAFGDCTALKDFYLMSSKQTSASDLAFKNVNTSNVTLHVNKTQFSWAKHTSPWKNFALYNIEFIDPENVNNSIFYNTEASDNTFTLTDGAYKSINIYEDIPMQTLTYTRNFSTANTWQALYVPFEMYYEDWSDKFDVAAINNFHEYTNENGETEKIELEVRYVKHGKLLANIPYLIRAKQEGEQTIVLSNVTLKATASNSIGCSSTERRYTFTGTYDAISQLQTKDYIFVSGGKLCKTDNDADVLKPMRWYLTVEDYFNVTGNATPALAKPMSIHVIGDNEATGIEDMTVVSSPVKAKTSGIYSISGVKLAKPQQGINIINGNKVIVK